MKGRVILALSLTVNFGLLGWLGLQLNHRSKPASNPVVKRMTRIVSPAGPERPPPADAAPLRPLEFHWSQIESADYPIYVANLRAIGAPENEIEERAGGILTREDVALKKRFFNQMLAALGQQLTPTELEEVELRAIGAMSFALADEHPTGLKLTGVELRELMRLKWHW